MTTSARALDQSNAIALRSASPSVLCARLAAVSCAVGRVR